MGNVDCCKKAHPFEGIVAHIERLSVVLAVEVAGMDGDESTATGRPWFYDLLMELDAEGWVTANVEAYLGVDETIGSERLLYLEYALELARSLQERTAYLGNGAQDHGAGLVDTWREELEDPMNAERVLEEYEEWAREWRPWEPALYRSEEDWIEHSEGEFHGELLARFDRLDGSSKPSTIVMLPLLAYPEEAVAIEQALGSIENDEERQRSTIHKALAMLEKAGHDVSGIAEMSILDGLDHVARLHDLHDVHEDLRLLIAEQIAPFDQELATHHEERRKALVEVGPSADVGGLRLQIGAIADNLHQRLAMLNDLLNEWREKGIHFPHNDGIRAGELLEWEANLPEIEATLRQHLAALQRWNAIRAVWPERAATSEHCAGVLEKTELFLDAVDELDQQWKQLELNAIQQIEFYEHAGLSMDAWHERVTNDPSAMLADLKRETPVLQKRLELIESIKTLDVSFGGTEDAEKRMDVLRELDVDAEVLEDTARFVDHHARRGARHRRMLEQDWRGLVAQGKANESTATSSFTLAQFESEIAHIRMHGTSIASTQTGGSLIAGDVHGRLKSRLEQELNLLSSSGWSVEELRSLSETDIVVASRKLNAARIHIEGHSTLVRRLAILPWNRDIALALDVEASLRDPLKIAVMSDRIARYARHLANRPVEDEHFMLTLWAPKPARKTLLPLPEHERLKTMVPADALGDAHEAMLLALEGAEEEPMLERIQSAGPRPAIIRPNEEPPQAPVHQKKPVPKMVEPSPKKTTEPDKVPATKPAVVQPRTLTPVEKETHVEGTEQVSDQVSTPRDAVDLIPGLVHFLHAIDCKILAVDVEENGFSAIPEVRRALAQHVGLEPRDSRVDRLLRLSLRLMPQDDDHDPQRIDLLQQLGTNTKNIKRWMRGRLEHRHSGSVDDFLVDAATLGKALQRIPGPGFKVPLGPDKKDLPNASDLAGLEHEVNALIGQMNPRSAGGISA